VHSDDSPAKFTPVKSLKSHPSIPSSSAFKTWQSQLSDFADEFINAVCQDTGRSYEESYLYDWLPIESTFDFLRDNLAEFAEPKFSETAMPWILGRRDIQKRRIPLGKVLIVGTWNFPLSLHLNQILFSIAAGNQVTFKGSPFATTVTKVFEKHLPKIFGEDKFTVWHAENEEVIKSLEDGEYQGLIFTGGSSAAKIYAKACAQSFTKCILEASGSEPALIHPSACNSDKKRNDLVDHLLWGLLHFTGQTCVAPRFWLVPRDEAEKIWKEIQSVLENDPKLFSERAPLRHDGVKQEYGAWCDWALALPHSEAYEPNAEHPAKFFYVKNLSDLPANSPSSFGPGAIIAAYDEWDDAVHWINASPWSLMPQCYYDSLSQEEWNSLQKIRATSISLGESIVAVGDAGLPFGGQRQSGTGITHGMEGLEELSQIQCFVEVETRPGLGKYTRPTWTNLKNLHKQVPLLKNVKKNPLTALFK